MLGEQIQTELTSTNIQWAHLSGRVLEGGYEIEQLLEATPQAAIFRVRVLGDRTVNAFMRLVRGNGAAADERLQLWEAARRLQHANVSTPLACGATQADGVACFYVVQRRPEETLSGVLRERPLTAEEAGEVLVSVSHALEHLLEKGLVHGCVSPEQIVAAGDSIQLTTECVRRIGAPPAVETVTAKYVAPESDRVNVTPAADIWCLGATLFETLTQREYDPGFRQKLQELPAPFATIAERCLTPATQARSDLSEVLALHRGEQIPQPQPISGAKPLPELVRIPEVKRTAEVGMVAVRKQPAAITGAPRTSRYRTSAARSEKRRGLPFWAYAVGAMLVALAIWAAWPRPAPKPARENAPARSGVPAPAGNAWETRTLPDEGSSAKPQPGPVPPQPASVVVAEPKTLNGPVWRVVLFTYNREQDARKKAHSVNERHPGVGAEVFSPSGHGAPYLVTVGGAMNREDAARLRRKAVSFGMPRDCYIQNYSR